MRHGRRRIAVLAAAVMGFGSGAVALAANASASPTCTGTTTVTCTFEYNGNFGDDGDGQDWTVPDGVTSVYFDVLGAGAGPSNGGRGGETTGTVAVTPGTVLHIFVGGSPTSIYGGFNGGGYAYYLGGTAGGGASDVRLGGVDLDNRVLVAGGGGGYPTQCYGSICSFGGSGGGAVGGDGRVTPGWPEAVAGGGGTQTAGGRGFDGAEAGSIGQGGRGAPNAGSGGGGYFGGAGGGELRDSSNNQIAISGGGGGSGFVLPDTTRVTNGAMANGMRAGNGLVRLSYTAPTTTPPPPSGKPAIRIADASTQEGNSGTHGLSFHVTMGKASTSPVTVHWATAKGTAQTPSDFVAASGTVTFSPGQKSKNVTVTIKGDHLKEPNEVFYVLLSNPSNATIADPNASGGILNDD